VGATLRQRIGFEVELLAPRGASRRTLADALAGQVDGTVRAVWHEDSEPSLVRSLDGRFLHLTQGFEVIRPSGLPLCTLVDDVTIAADLDSAAAAPPGWHRILTDDPRLLRLLARCSDPAGPLDTALDEVAALWGVLPEQIGSIWRVESVGTVALALPAGGERERPCEVITPPLSSGHEAALAELLTPAAALGFTVPDEAAVHLHVDAAPFRAPAALANVIRLFAWWREPLHVLLGTNPRCRRLAALPHPLVDAVAGKPTIDELRTAAKTGGLRKFCDVNLTQLLLDHPFRDTVEVRVLPGSIDATDIVARAAMVERLLDRCLDPTPYPAPPDDPDAALALLRAAAGA